MLVGCPQCRTRYRLDDSRVKADGVILRCGQCRTFFRLAGKAASAGKSAAPDQSRRDKTILTVLIANESPDFCSAVARVLSKEPFRVISANDGGKALEIVEECRPDVVLLDVALPTVYGFEICERIRQNPALASVRTILIASIYDKTRYKREPQSLYGADDYIEKHHIPDSLAAKIYRLVFDQKPLASGGAAGGTDEVGDCRDTVREVPGDEAAVQEEVREKIRQDEERKTSSTDIPGLAAYREKARRLARIIVSDICLYNQKKVEEGIRSGTFRELLSEEIQEGRLLFGRRFPEAVREGTSYLEEAIEEFISRKSLELFGPKKEMPEVTAL